MYVREKKIYFLSACILHVFYIYIYFLSYARKIHVNNYSRFYVKNLNNFRRSVCVWHTFAMLEHFLTSRDVSYFKQVSLFPLHLRIKVSVVRNVERTVHVALGIWMRGKGQFDPVRFTGSPRNGHRTPISHKSKKPALAGFYRVRGMGARSSHATADAFSPLFYGFVAVILIRPSCLLLRRSIQEATHSWIPSFFMNATHFNTSKIVDHRSEEH